MLDSLCYSCMEEKENNEVQCSKCGYINGSETRDFVLEAGSILEDRYVIGKPLGVGGFGITYIALDKRINVKVAVKEFYIKKFCQRKDHKVEVIGKPKDKRTYKIYKEKFLNEAHLLAGYNDVDGIVAVSDYFLDNNSAYLVMEFLEGDTLEAYLKENGTFNSFDSAIEVVLPLFDALRIVHSKGIIHRDISPDNIYITSEGQIKLLDFGAARETNLDSEKKLSVILKSGYAPVEQYDKNGRQGPFTDIYALGAVIYRMLEGRKPKDSMERMSSEEKSYGKVKEHLSKRNEEILSKMLAVDSKDRYSTIDEIYEDLGISTVYSRRNMSTNKMFSLPPLASKILRGVYYAVCFSLLLLLIGIYAFEDVPDYSGMRYFDVQEEIVTSKLEHDVQFAYDNQVQKGIIVSQSVEPGWHSRWKPSAIIVSSGSDEVIEFKDESFEGYILDIVENQDGAVRAGDVIDIVELDLSNKNIESIRGIEYFENLESLNISDNQISDISMLSELKYLRVLNVRGNLLSALDSVFTITSIEILYASDNELTTLKGIDALENLIELNVQDNEIIDISGLEGMTQLKRLYLGNNTIEKIQVLSTVETLTTLLLTNNMVDDISNISDFENLKYINIQGNDFDLDSSMQYIEVLENKGVVAEF